MEEAGNGRLGRSGLIVAISIGLALFFDHIFWDHIPGIGFTLFVVAIVAAYLGIVYYSKKSIHTDLLWLFPLLIFFASMVAIRANLLLTALNVLGCVLLLLLSAEVSVRGSVRQFVPWDYFKLLFPFKFIYPLFQAITDVLSIRKDGKESKKRTQIVRGIFITVPVLILFAMLFASADPIFENYVSVLFNWHFEEEHVVRAIIVFVVAIGLAASYAYALTAVKEESGGGEGTKRGVSHIETGILLGSVNALFLTFLLVQLTYLFGGASNITTEGLTYAEYARRGFFELIAIAVFSYLILAGVEKYIERDSGGHSQQFKLLSSALVAQIVIIMLSAFSRLSLYEEAFGFTTLRLYSHAFIIFLGVVFCFLLYKILVEHKDNTFAFRTFLAVVVFVAAMNIFNPDTFIATKNLERYEATGKLDADYLAGLSADATAITIHTLQLQDPDIRGTVGRALYERYYDRNSASAEWPSWNVSRYQETILLEKHADELLLYKNYESE